MIFENEEPELKLDQRKDSVPYQEEQDISTAKIRGRVKQNIIREPQAFKVPLINSNRSK